MEEEDNIYSALTFKGSVLLSPSVPGWVSDIVLWEEFPKLIPWDSSDEMPMLWRARIQSLNKMRAVANEAKNKGNK